MKEKAHDRYIKANDPVAKAIHAIQKILVAKEVNLCAQIALLKRQGFYLFRKRKERAK